jgi:hypothetical protein
MARGQHKPRIEDSISNEIRNEMIDLGERERLDLAEQALVAAKTQMARAFVALGGSRGADLAAAYGHMARVDKVIDRERERLEPTPVSPLSELLLGDEEPDGGRDA